MKVLFIDGVAGGTGSQVTFCDLIVALKANPDISVSAALPLGICFNRLQAAGVQVFAIELWLSIQQFPCASKQLPPK